MKKNAVSVRFLAGFLVLILLFSLSGCDGEKKEEATYRKNVTAAMTDVSKANAAYSEALKTFSTDLSESGRQKVLSSLQGMKNAYQKMKDLKAPSKYTNIQKTLSEDADLAFSAIEIYQKELGSVTKKTFNDDFMKQLAKGDTLMQQANAKLLEGSRQCIDHLNSILAASSQSKEKKA